MTLSPAIVAMSPKQVDFLKYSAARVNVCSGSIRSGKTIVTLVRWLHFVGGAPRGGELVMFGRTRDAVWRNCIMPLQNPTLFGELSSQVVGNYGAPTVSIMGRRVHVLGASDSKAEKVIRGMTVAGAYFDEITVAAEELFTQLLGRMSVEGAKLFGSTNPDNPAHWLKQKFLDRVDDLPDWKHWHFTLMDNPSLSAEYIASISAEFTGLWYRRFILGEWVAAEGAIFPMFDPQQHIVKWDDLPRMEKIMALGVDYGTTNPSAAIVVGLGVDGNLYALDEWSYSGRERNNPLTDAQLADRLEDFQATDHAPDDPRNPDVFILDPSAASFRTELALRGQPVVNADNDVSYGIQTLASLFGEQRLYVSTRCTRLINEIPGYSWDDKATEEGKDKPVQLNDHAIDALRYAVVTTERYWRPMLGRKVAA